ncbi:MAG: serine/threonine-protein kinase [Candidatus Melainabacteria bacterium]|nr:serine/threonine-protein kinase [Candidatus Melainabacteria bacterium]
MVSKSDDDRKLEKTVQEDDEEDSRLDDLRLTYRDKLQASNPPDPNRDQLIGKIIGGHYVILELIGEGGMSQVYKAKHMLLNRTVAVKYILPKYVYDLPSVKRFQQEAQAATALKHPNVCAVNEFGIDGEGRSYLVMDYIEGVSLAKILDQETKLNVDRALEIFAQVSDGLEHAHSKGVIHRDITPGNIVIVKEIDGSDCVKLVDFGIAKLVKAEGDDKPNLTRTGEIFGTPVYMSPEQCLGRNIDVRSDVYSLGCVLYEAITGSQPFKGESSLEVMMAHVNGDAPTIPVTMAQARVRNIVEQCMRKDPTARYQSVKDFRDDLLAVQSGEAPTNLKVIITGRTYAWHLFMVLMIVALTVTFAYLGYVKYRPAPIAQAQAEQIQAPNTTP